MNADVSYDLRLAFVLGGVLVGYGAHDTDFCAGGDDV